MRFGMRTVSCAALVLTTLFSPSLAADPVADFYRGKRLSLYVGSDAGGGYDTYARLIAPHLGPFMPGNPDFIVQYMSGGGGIRVTNNLYNVVANDGTAVRLVQRAILSMALLEA